MERKICFMMETPFEKRDYERFGIEILKKRGFDVFILDTTEYFNPDFCKVYQAPDVYDYRNVVKVKTKEDLSTFFKTNKDAFYVDVTGLYFKTIRLYKLMKDYDITYASNYTNYIPMDVTGKGSIFSTLTKTIFKIMRNIRQPLAKNVLKRIKNYYVRFLVSGIQYPRYVLMGGEKSESQLGRYEKRAEKVWIHTFDYDAFLKAKDRKDENTDQHIVYLDEYYPFHPDYLIYGLPIPLIDPRRFYQNLCKLFGYLEKKIGIPVVIAAHPRSCYEEHEDYFEGRKIEKYKTIDLVRNSKCVVAHSSTSINFAALYGKPIIFVTTNDLKKHIFSELISNSAKEFNKGVHNLDNEIRMDLEKELNVKEEVYGAYVKNYIKIPGTPEKLFWEIVADRLESINK